MFFAAKRTFIAAVLVLTGVSLLLAGSASAQVPAGLTELWSAPEGLGSSKEATVWLAAKEAEAAQINGGCPRVQFPQLFNNKPTKAFEITLPSTPIEGSPVIVNDQDAIVERFLVFFSDKKGCLQIVESGRVVPFTSRDVLSPFPNVRVPSSVSGKTVAVVIQDSKAIRPWVRVALEPEFQRETTLLWVLLGGYTGILFILMLVGIGFAFWHRTYLTVSYVLYLVGLQFWQLQALGVGPAWIPFWPGPEHFKFMQALAVSTVVATVSNAVIAFLQLKGSAKLVIAIGAGISSIAFFSSAWSMIGYRTGSLLLAILAILVLYYLMKRLREKETFVRWFALGLASTMIGGGTQAFSVVSGGAGMTGMTTFAFPLGTLFESVLWLVALASYMRAHRKRMEQQLIYDATHDALTTLPNRYFLTSKLETCLKNAKRDKTESYGLLFLDLDRFKVVNDSLGHKVGDDILVSVGALLKSVVPMDCTVARFGGDEFVILMGHPCDREYLDELASRIIALFNDEPQVGNRSVRLQASIGIVVISGEYSEVVEIIRDFDIALYAAKRQGGGCYAYFETAMRDTALQRFWVENDLVHGLREGQFELKYQPIVEITSGIAVGFEALIRWNHPTQGMLRPDDFIPIAEETGLIWHLDNWVVIRAIEQIAEWQKRAALPPDFYVSINLSGLHLTGGGIVDQMDKLLERYLIKGSAIRIEVTETAVISNIDIAKSILPQFRQRGIKICMDDFGTGYSSLSYLSELPFDVLKIDRSFINEIEDRVQSQKLVRTILVLADELELMVIAEGVENERQYEMLLEMGCDCGQGYLFAKPLSAADVMVWLEKNQG